MATQDDYTRITLRIPKDLHQQLADAAEATSKSMNAEIVARLQDSFTPRDATAAALANAELKAFMSELSMLSAVVSLTQQFPRSDERDSLLKKAISRFDAMGDIDQRLKQLIQKLPVETAEPQ